MIIRSGIVFFFFAATSLNAATLYVADGTPTAGEEQQRWLINRARFAPENEADRLGLVNSGYPDYDVCEDIDPPNDFGSGPGEWAAWLVSLPPLATHTSLINSARNHSDDMASIGYPDGFDHYTQVETHYTNDSSPGDRMTAEGYDWWTCSENLAIGGLGSSGLPYPAEGLSSEDAHDQLFVDDGVASRGHRQSILGSGYREIGCGWARNQQVYNSKYYTFDWYTDDFGARNGEYFFTGTLFTDSIANGKYDQGEGVGGIEVRLFDGAVECGWYDISSASGGFAIPIKSLTAGHTILVKLVNDGTPRALSIPNGYDSVRSVSLGANETVAVAMFTQPGTVLNVGFRNTTPVHPVVASAGNNGGISPSGTSYVPEGVNTTFTFTADSYYHVDEVLVDGSDIGVPASWTFTNVVAAHTVSVSFAENLVTNSTPEVWLASYNLMDFANDATNDPDGDGLPTWMEYQAGTHPTNGDSKFAVMNIIWTNGHFEVKWFGTTNSGVTTPFRMYRCTNLVEGSWSLLPTNIVRSATGTNTWYDPDPPSNTPVYYRPAIILN